MSKPVLHILTASTRPGRKGPLVSKWMLDVAEKHAGFTPEIVDLADFNLPVFDEPIHPMMQKYEHEHTKKWATKVNEADAFVFVLPEYNFTLPPSLLNAIDYLYKEWNYKAVAMLSYSMANSSAQRSAQAARNVSTTVKMMPMYESVAIASLGNQLNEAGEFVPEEHQETSATGMLDELLKWTTALKTIRN